MSIIYDALNKTQQNLSINSPDAPKAPKKKNLLWLYLGYLIVGSLCCLVVIILIFHTPKAASVNDSPGITGKISKVKGNLSSKALSQVQIKSQEQSPIPELPKLSLKLNGIITISSERIVLVNDKILKEGDFIEGLQVVKIYDRSVDFKFADKVYSLELK